MNKKWSYGWYGTRYCVLGTVLMLSGCNQDMSDLQQYITSVKARPPAPIEPIPMIKPYVRFIYPGHEIDPFNDAVLQAKVSPVIPESIHVDKSRMPEFLESFPLDSLRMVGTVYKEDELWALVRIPDGAVHRVKKGNYLGKNQGKVTTVKDMGITLTEVVDNGFGGYKEQDNLLTISGPDKPL